MANHVVCVNGDFNIQRTMTSEELIKIAESSIAVFKYAIKHNADTIAAAQSELLLETNYNIKQINKFAYVETDVGCIRKRSVPVIYKKLPATHAIGYYVGDRYDYSVAKVDPSFVNVISSSNAAIEKLIKCQERAIKNIRSGKLTSANSVVYITSDHQNFSFVPPPPDIIDTINNLDITSNKHVYSLNQIKLKKVESVKTLKCMSCGMVIDISNIDAHVKSAYCKLTSKRLKLGLSGYVPCKLTSVVAKMVINGELDIGEAVPIDWVVLVPKEIDDAIDIWKSEKISGMPLREYLIKMFGKDKDKANN